MRALRSAPLFLLLAAVSCATSRAGTTSTPEGAAGSPQPAGPAKAAAAEGPRAILWEVTRPGAPERPLYLTGSIHVGKPDQFPFPPSLDAAFARSTALVVELDPGALDLHEAQRLSVRLGLAKSPAQFLSKTIDAETRSLLPAALQRVGLTPEAVEPMRAWFVAVSLSVLELQKAGFSAKDGIDNVLLARARGHKQIVELETVESQLTALAGLPDEVQALMLRDTIRTAPLTPGILARVAAAWEGGDAEAIAAVVLESASDPRFAPIYEALFTVRNKAMTARLARLIDEPGTHFVVVGVGHVVGPEGIAALLARRGFLVRQLGREARVAAAPP